MTERTWLQRLEGNLSLRAMWAEVTRINLLQRVTTLQMPVFLFLGRRNHWVPSEQSLAFFDALRAPSKKLVWFEASGHEPFMDEPENFNTAMVELVRPLLPGGRLAGSEPSTQRH